MSDSMAIRVLVADDNTLIRKQIRTIIESDAELEVCAEAANGLEAVEKAQESCPDVAVIDFQMQVMDGLKATRKIKEANAISTDFTFHTIQFSSA